MALRGRIIIASGDKKNLQAIEHILNPLNYDISTYSDLAKLASEIIGEKPDLLILDSDKVPGDVFELSRKLKSGAFEKLPIVLMTSSPIDDKMLKLVEESKIDEYVRKPASYALLLEKMKRMLLVETKASGYLFEDGQEFNFTGDFSSMPFPRILYCLKRDARTGVLSISRDSAKKVISFEKGDPKFVVSNIVQECLGRLLVGKGRLTNDECEESLRLMKEWRTRQGETLIRMGLIEPYELDEALKMQAKERLLETFGWHTGDYKFHEKKTLREDLTSLDIEIPQIVLLGVRRYYTLDILKKFLDNFMEYIPFYNDNPPFEVPKFRLATWDAKTARLVDGKRTLKQIISQRAVREIDVYHLIFAFYSLSVLRFVESDISLNAARSKLENEKARLLKLNAFQVLNVGYDVSDQDAKRNFESLQKKYVGLAKKIPGDMKGIARELTEIIKEAYHLIKNVKSRHLYLKKLFLEDGFFVKESAKVVTDEEVLARAKSFISRNALAKAKALLLNASTLFPENGLVYSYLGYANLLEESLENSKDPKIMGDIKRYLKRGIALSPVQEDAHLIYGKFLKYTGKGTEAMKSFRRVIQINPYNNDALQELRLFSMRERKKATSFIKWKK